MKKYFITIDPYSDINSYNVTLEALKNNNIPFEEFLNTKPPYNWYINVDTLPVFINYDLATKNQIRFFVAKVKPLFSNESYLLKRRETDGSGLASINKFIYNDVFKEHQKYALCFRYNSKVTIQDITRRLGTKVFLLGTYRGWKLAVTFNKYIKSEIPPDFVVFEKQQNEYNNPGEFERMINYFGLRKKDFIVKRTATEYIKNGKFYPIRRNV